MSTVEYIEKAWIAYKKNFWQIFAAILLQILVFLVPVIIGLMPWVFVLTPFSRDINLTKAMLDNLGIFSFSVVMFIVGILASTILKGGFVRMLYESLNRRTRFEVMFKTVQSKFWTILGANLIVLLILFVIVVAVFSPATILISFSGFSLQTAPTSYLFFIFLSIILGAIILVLFGILFIFINQAVVIDNLSAFQAVKRSFVISKRYFLSVLFLFFMFFFFNAGLNSVLRLLGTLLTLFVTSPLVLLSYTAFYVDRRKKVK